MKFFTTMALCAAMIAPAVANAEALDFFKYARFAMPSSEKCPIDETFRESGMGIITMAAVDNLEINDECTGNATIEYSATADGAKTLLKSVPIKFDENGDGTGVTVFGVAASADDVDPGEIPSNNTIYFAFVTVSDVEYKSPKLEPYKKYGFYTLTFPEGAFMLRNEDGSTTMLTGETVTYELTAPVAEELDFSYTVSPNSGTDITDLINPDPKKNNFSLTLTFTNCKSVSYTDSGCGAKLQNGTTILANSFPSFSDDHKSLIFSFGNSSTNWKNGTWNFTIPANRLVLNPKPNKEYEEGNVPEIKGIYFVIDNGGQSAIAAIGLEPADSYTVVTLDGKVVLKDASSEALTTLAPAIYIINGKKVVIK